MDRHRRRSLALGAGAALILTGLAAAEGFALRAMGWLAPGADPAAVLTVEPAECLTLFTDAAHRASVEIGRAAFRTPVLLGGQAARAGLSCESCHRGGRSNAGFLFPGVSGRPGTADVTSSLFSSHRGDGVDDPLPIPDLAGDRARLKVAPGALAPFIPGRIVAEFAGPLRGRGTCDASGLCACAAGYRAADDRYAGVPKVRFAVDDVVKRV